MKKIIFLSLLLAILVSGCSLTIPIFKQTKVLKPEEARAAAEKFINDNLLPANIKATVKSATLEGDVYNVSLDVNGTPYTSYMTKDGSKFFQTGIDIAKFLADSAANKAAPAADQTQAQNVPVPKNDKPKVELFVLTYCPYGLQAEKGYLPAIAALGNKVDASIKFLHYFMHGANEESETYNQVCIRNEQAAKYNSYLSCFIDQGDSAKCVTQTGVNKAKLDSCLKTKAKDYYKVDSGLSQGYAVQGSPTLIINGVQSNAGRDSASYLAGICAAFNNKPSECSKQLSSASPSSGFGAGTAAAGSNTAAGCAPATPPQN